MKKSILCFLCGFFNLAISGISGIETFNLIAGFFCIGAGVYYMEIEKAEKEKKQ